MIRRPNLARGALTAVVFVVAALVATGCGGSKSTGPTSTIALAAHFDSLAIHAQDSQFVDRSVLLTYPTAALAVGVHPVTKNLTVDGSARSFQLVAMELVVENPSTGSAVDSSYFVIAWSGANVHQLFYAQLAEPAGTASVVQLVDTLTAGSSSATMTATLTPTASTCAVVDLASTYDLLHDATCTSATMHAAFTASFPAATGFATQVSLGTTDIPGARILLRPNRGV